MIVLPAGLRQIELAWEIRRNTDRATVDWRFTTADARIKLKKLYPVIHCEENVKENGSEC